MDWRRSIGLSACKQTKKLVDCRFHFGKPCFHCCLVTCLCAKSHISLAKIAPNHCHCLAFSGYRAGPIFQRWPGFWLGHFDWHNGFTNHWPIFHGCWLIFSLFISFLGKPRDTTINTFAIAQISLAEAFFQPFFFRVDHEGCEKEPEEERQNKET